MLSWLPLPECAPSDRGSGDRMSTRAFQSGRQGGGGGEGESYCPDRYRSFATYSEQDEVALDGRVYRCKRGPTWQWCNMFEPNYTVESSGSWSGGAVHRTNDDLGWELIGDCGGDDGGDDNTSVIRSGAVYYGDGSGRNGNGKRNKADDGLEYGVIKRTKDRDRADCGGGCGKKRQQQSSEDEERNEDRNRNTYRGNKDKGEKNDKNDSRYSKVEIITDRDTRLNHLSNSIYRTFTRASAY